MEALKGKNQILLWRLLKDAATASGAKLAFQTEHSVSKSRSTDTTITKDGPIVTGGGFEEEVPFTCIMAKDDPVVDLLNSAIADDEVLELWEVNITDGGEAGKYPGKYRQGVLSELNETKNAEDLVELEGTFITNGMAKDGEVTLTAEQAEVVQYAFRDVTPYTEE